MDMIISITCYLITVLLAYFIVVTRYKKVYIGQKESVEQGNTDYQRKMTFIMILSIAVLFTLYNVIVTKLNPTVASDRRNYALNFYGYRASPSAGLSFIINVVRRFSNNVESLYYVCTFIPVLITLIAYRVCKEAMPKALLFLLSTQYIFHTFAGLKQCYANAFATLCIVFAMRNKSVKDTVYSILSIIASIWFHHTGYFLIPVYIMIRLRKNRKSLLLFYLVMAVLVVFLEPILIRVSSLLSPFASIVSNKINEYFGDAASIQADGGLTIVKGIPFYIITIVGLIKRRQLINVVENYDNYLFVSSIVSFAYIATIYNGWVYRLSYFFYFPVGVFYGILINNISNTGNRRIIGMFTLGLSFLLTIRFLVLTYMNYGGF